MTPKLIVSTSLVPLPWGYVPMSPILLTNGPLLIETPLSKAVHQLNLVVLVSAGPGGLENFHSCGEFDVIFVVIAPGCQRELKLAVKLSQVIQISASQSLQPAKRQGRCNTQTIHRLYFRKNLHSVKWTTYFTSIKCYPDYLHSSETQRPVLNVLKFYNVFTSKHSPNYCS